MILEFRCADTQDLFEGRRVARFVNIEAVAIRKLQQLNVDGRKIMSRQVAFVHPGEILLKDWLEPMGLSQYALAKAIEVPPRRINEIVKGLRGITVDTALRLAAFFDTDAQSWLNLQNHYDTELARQAMRVTLRNIERHRLASQD